MSASFIQEQHLINNHDGDSKVHKLPATAITTADTSNHSQVLEIPFELLHTAHYTSSTQPISNIPLSNERTNGEQLSWSTSSLKSTTSSSHIETNSARAIVPSKLRLVNGTVTHSFANRKKSITKHRKSVLSHSFTAEEDNGSNMDEAIRHDREATLAALERGRIKAIQSTFSVSNGEECLREMKKEEGDQEEEIINKKEGKQTIRLQHQEESNDCLKEKLANEDEGYQYCVENSTNIYSQRNITFDLSEDEMENDSTVERRMVQHVLYFSKNHDKTTTVLSIGRGSSVLQKERGFRKPEGNNKKSLLQDGIKDSVTDLNSTVSVESESKLPHQRQQVDNFACSISFFESDNTAAFEFSLPSFNPIYSLNSSEHISVSSTLPTKKKASSWLPRKIFQSSSNKRETLKNTSKKPSSTALSDKLDSSNDLQHDESSSAEDFNTTKTTTPKQHQEKFNISSLFFNRKSTSFRRKNSVGLKKSSKKPSSTTVINKDFDTSSSSLSDSTTNDINAVQLSTFNHTRLPIHTERAIYRMSHLKLTNSKRPLRDQVVISNLMFWYLSIIKQPLIQDCANNNSNTTTTSLGDVSDSKMNRKSMYRNYIKQQQQQFIIHNKKNRKYRNVYQNGPRSDMIQPKHALNMQRRPIYHRKTEKIDCRPSSNSRQMRSMCNSSSSSEEESSDEDNTSDESDDDGDSLLVYSSEEESFCHNFVNEKNLHDTAIKKKYSILKGNQGDNKKPQSAMSWLPSLSNFKQSQSEIDTVNKENEDSIPLAMYQKGI